MTENALTPQQNFEEKVKSRMRENIGDLMPDEVLQEMINKAMQEMFFTRRTNEEGYGRRTELPSWFEDQVATQLKEQVLAETKKAVDEKREDIQKAAIEMITKNLGTIVAKIICDTITGVPQQISSNIQMDIMSNLRNRGFNV